MKDGWTLSGVGRQVLRLTTVSAHGGRRSAISPVLTVADVCRRLRKSRRQVYRYLSAGRLRPCAQVLGQWLFAKAEIDRCAKTHVPSALWRFFWDVRLASLSVDRHRDFILARLLAFGDRQALRWAFRTYPRQQAARFLATRGADVLDRRTWQFWASQLGVRRRRSRTSSWRSRGRAWGGLR